MVSCGPHKLWMLNSQMPWAWGSATETPTEALTRDPCSLSILNSSFFSVSCHLGQQTEGSIWCMDPKHVTFHCARTSVLPGAGTADQLAKQVCQCVKIPANSFPRFLEYYTTSFNSKAFCPCKLPALWSELTILTTKHKLFLQSTPGSPKRCSKSMAWSFWNLGKHKPE